MPVRTDQGTIALLLPEILLVLAAAMTMVGSSFARARSVWLGTTLLAFFGAVGLLLGQGQTLVEAGQSSADHVSLVSGPLFVDLFGHWLRWGSVAVGLLFVLIAARAGQDTLSGEYLGLLTLVTVGLMLASIAADLVLLFLAMELISIPTYVLLFLGRRDRQTAEATAKYFFLSILSSALLLYGFSFLYGLAGTTQLVEMRDRFTASAAGQGDATVTALLPLVLVLIFAGLGFKIAAVPFHFYAPDVYQGTSNANAGLLAVAPKIVGIVALTRVLVVAVGPTMSLGWQIALVLSLLTMTVGNVCALWQKNIRRLLAYSSIAHGGYMLIGLAVALAATDAPTTASDGLAATLFYLGVYVVASLGAFAALVYLSRTDRELNDISELAGLGRSCPLIGAAIAVFMFSLSGIPPLAGFWGKLALFTSALAMGLRPPTGVGEASGWFFVLAIVGVVNAAIAAAYYLRIVGVMYFQSSDRKPTPGGGPTAQLSALLCAVLVVAIGLWPARLAGLSRDAALSTRVSSGPRAALVVLQEPAADVESAIQP